MSNRSRITEIHATLEAFDAALSEMGVDLPSRTASTRIGRAQDLARGAATLLAQALKERVDGMADPLDRPPHPQGRWGERLWHPGGPRPAGLDLNDWVGDDGYSATAIARNWSRPFEYRLRAGHPLYAATTASASTSEPTQ